jgi:hypothetical protein
MAGYSRKVHQICALAQEGQQLEAEDLADQEFEVKAAAISQYIARTFAKNMPDERGKRAYSKSQQGPFKQLFGAEECPEMSPSFKQF